MPSPQTSDATSPSPAGQLGDAVTSFVDAVVEATGSLLQAQQELTRALLHGSGGQIQPDVADESTTGGDEQEEADRVATDAGGDEYGDGQDEATSEVADEEAETDEETEEVDEADDEADEDVEETGVESGAEQAGGDLAPAAALATGRPRRGRPSRRGA